MDTNSMHLSSLGNLQSYKSKCATRIDGDEIIKGLSTVRANNSAVINSAKRKTFLTHLPENSFNEDEDVGIFSLQRKDNSPVMYSGKRKTLTTITENSNDFIDDEAIRKRTSWKKQSPLVINSGRKTTLSTLLSKTSLQDDGNVKRLIGSHMDRGRNIYPNEKIMKSGLLTNSGPSDLINTRKIEDIRKRYETYRSFINRSSVLPVCSHNLDSSPDFNSKDKMLNVPVGGKLRLNVKTLGPSNLIQSEKVEEIRKRHDNSRTALTTVASVGCSNYKESSIKLEVGNSGSTHIPKPTPRLTDESVPVNMYCSNCEKVVLTLVTYKHGLFTCVSACFCSIVMPIFIFCVWMPFVLRMFKDITHACPDCGNILSVSNRMSA